MKPLVSLGAVVLAVTSIAGVDRYRDAGTDAPLSCHVERDDSAVRSTSAEFVLIGDCAYLPGSYVDLASTQ